MKKINVIAVFVSFDFLLWQSSLSVVPAELSACFEFFLARLLLF